VWCSTTVRTGDFVARDAQVAPGSLHPCSESVDGRARKTFARSLFGERGERGGQFPQPRPCRSEPCIERLGIGRGKVRRGAAGQECLDLGKLCRAGCLEARNVDPEAIGVGSERALLDQSDAGETTPDDGGHPRGREQHSLRHPAAANVQKRQPPADGGRRRGERVPPCQVFVERLFDDPGVDEVPQLLVHDLDLAYRALTVEFLMLAERGAPLVDDLGRVHDAQDFLRVQQSSGSVHVRMSVRGIGMTGGSHPHGLPLHVRE